jgi:hypothetical protein
MLLSRVLENVKIVGHTELPLPSSFFSSVSYIHLQLAPQYTDLI